MGGGLTRIMNSDGGGLTRTVNSDGVDRHVVQLPLMGVGQIGTVTRNESGLKQTDNPSGKQ